MKEKKVTILYTVYKENIDLIKQSFESLLNQTYSNIEIIILLDIIGMMLSNILNLLTLTFRRLKFSRKGVIYLRLRLKLLKI